MLDLSGVSVSYGDLRVIRGVHVNVKDGEIVTLIGANAAGKSTMIKAISGLLPGVEGRITFDGGDVSALPAEARVELGLIQVPEGRRLFPSMTVEENLVMGSICRRAKPKRKANLERVYALFPRVRERREQLAGSLSGGEQQMCAIGRAMMAEPRLLMLDEPSLGLAPLVVADIFRTIVALRETGVTVFLVEQNAKKALSVSDRAYVLKDGEIAQEGRGRDLLENDDVKRAYLGV